MRHLDDHAYMLTACDILNFFVYKSTISLVCICNTSLDWIHATLTFSKLNTQLSGKDDWCVRLWGRLNQCDHSSILFVQYFTNLGHVQGGVAKLTEVAIIWELLYMWSFDPCLPPQRAFRPWTRTPALSRGPPWWRGSPPARYEVALAERAQWGWRTLSGSRAHRSGPARPGTGSGRRRPASLGRCLASSPLKHHTSFMQASCIKERTKVNIEMLWRSRTNK